MNNKNNPKNILKRFIGKVREFSGSYGPFHKIQLDNVEYKNGDGTENKYWKGNLIWFDNVTGKRYKVKSIYLKGANDEMRSKGIVNSVMLDLGDSFCVEEME